MTEEIRTFDGSYDAKLSVAHAMAEVGDLWRQIAGKSMPVTEAEGYFKQITMWLSIAQVHATAALVYATEAAAAPKKTCRCIK